MVNIRPTGSAEWNNLLEIINSKWNSCLSGTAKILFVHCDTPAKLQSSLKEHLQNLEPEKVFYHSSIPAHGFLEPYYPFLQFIKDYLHTKETQEIQAFLRSAGVYSLHQDLLYRFLTSQPLVRKEELILEELAYEKKRMEQSIINMMVRISFEQPIILFINNLHLANESCLRLLQAFGGSTITPGRILVICLFNKNHRFVNEVQNNYWTAFTNWCQNCSLVSFNQPPLGKPFTKPNIPDDPNPPVTIEEQINVGLHCLHLLAMVDCQEIGKRIFNNIFDEKSLETRIYMRLLTMLGDSSRYLGDNDNALTYYQIALDLCEDEGLLSTSADLVRKIGHVYLQKHDFEAATQMANRSLKLAEQIKDRFQMLKAYEVQCTIEYKIAEFRCWETSHEKLCALLKEFNFENTLSYFLSTQPIHFRSPLRKILELQNQVIEIALRLGNEYRLANTNQFIGVIYSFIGDFNRSLEYYKKSTKIRIELGQVLEISQINNGIGYLYFLNGQFEEALNYFIKALKSIGDIRNYPEIMITCYNIAVVYYFNFQHQHAIYYLENLLAIVHALNYNYMRFHSLYGIYMFLGVNQIKSGNITAARECLQKGLQYEPINEEESFYFELLQAFLENELGHYEQALQHFKKAQSYADSLKELTDFKKLFPRFYYDYGAFEHAWGHTKKAHELWRKGIQASTEIKYTMYTDLLQSALDPRLPRPKQKILRHHIFDFKWILETAKQENKLNQMHKKINEINFINNLQKTTSDNYEVEPLIRNTMQLINNHFAIDYFYLYLMTDGDWKAYCYSEPPEALKPVFPRLFEKIANETADLFIPDLNEHPSYRDFANIIHSAIILQLMGDNKRLGFMFFLNNKRLVPFSIDDYRVFSTAARQIAAGLEKIHLNLELKEMVLRLKNLSLQDELTNLYNRRGFITLAEQQMKVAKRNNKGLLVLFIDVDNLKVINDQFGHEVGDEALKSVAKALRLSFRDSDIVARLGGDEFVVMVLDTTMENFPRICRVIQMNIRTINEENQIKVPVEVSIGCAEYDPLLDPSVERLMAEADRKMYQQKTAKKKNPEKQGK